ncbi:class I SAM-dependent methyltransferase [Vineibacter terrae]|uniref:class I SAM-dependent methyltransferase n=1 Tax=Vineibacter terrae TaxID=2586908 RepID=UPI002E37D4A9|nr:class I SAM-dependent methyltransferase [Vineibacter terrae]HEX2889163.1 class I SAM-dependent methyltransferase [Vineibacter terrae]
MERHEYERMHALEERLWWYRGLHGLIADHVASMAGGSFRPLLDAGCGTGGLLAALARRGVGRSRLGLEYDAQAARLAAARGDAAIVVGSVTALPFGDDALGAMVSADVLPHRLVEPDVALKEAHRCLETGGILILNLPAYRWMASAHDRHVHNVRRFTRRQAAALAQAAGFRVRRATYWNCILFPLMVARRVLTRWSTGGSDVRPFPAPINWLFGAIVGVERRLIGWGVGLPFGGSILLVVQKGKAEKR